MLTSLKGVYPALKSSLNSSLMYPTAHLPLPHGMSNQHLKVNVSRTELWGPLQDTLLPAAVPTQLSAASSSSLLRLKPLESPVSRLGCVHACSAAQSCPTGSQLQCVSRIQQLLTTTALITLILALIFCHAGCCNNFPTGLPAFIPAPWSSLLSKLVERSFKT